jgi:hypothetical protein
MIFPTIGASTSPEAYFQSSVHSTHIPDHPRLGRCRKSTTVKTSVRPFAGVVPAPPSALAVVVESSCFR